MIDGIKADENIEELEQLTLNAQKGQTAKQEGQTAKQVSPDK
jgi:uridine kinase